MRQPFSPLLLFLFIFALGFLLAIVQLGVITLAFDKLGVSPFSALILLFGSLFGSLVNIPLFVIRSDFSPQTYAQNMWRLLNPPMRQFTGKTIIAVNVGGCVIPFLFSVYLLLQAGLPFHQMVMGVLFVSAVSYMSSRPIPGLGVGMPLFIAPISAALCAIMINPLNSAPLAYVSGTLGVIIGADMLRLKDIRKMGTPMASIGGAGTFDGIFITGIVAVLLA